jgi:predicted amidophosphoribosyltransferase
MAIDPTDYSVSDLRDELGEVDAVEDLEEALEIEQHLNMLQRVDATGTQTKKGRYERWLNVSQAFQLNDPSDRLEGPVLIVDDVLTTGSTLEACARSILREGKGPVAVASIACA